MLIIKVILQEEVVPITLLLSGLACLSGLEYARQVPWVLLSSTRQARFSYLQDYQANVLSSHKSFRHIQI